MGWRDRYTTDELLHSELSDMPSGLTSDHDDTYYTQTRLSSTDSGQGASLVGIIAGTGSPTVTDMQAYLDNTGSSGYLTGG